MGAARGWRDGAARRGAANCEAIANVPRTADGLIVDAGRGGAPGASGRGIGRLLGARDGGAACLVASLERSRGFWVVMWAAGVLGELAALWPVLAGDRPAEASAVIYRLTGGSFVAAGLIAWQRRAPNRVGALMVATGLLFFLEQLPGRLDSSLAQTLGLVVAGSWMIPFVVLLLVFPQSRWIRGRLEQLVVLAFAAHLVLQPVWLLFVERPGLANDLGVVPSERAADWIHEAQTVVLLLAAVALFLVIGARFRRASPLLRRVLVPVLVGGAVMLSLAAMLAAELIDGARSQTLLTLTLAVLAAVPLAFLGGLLRARLGRAVVGELLIGLRGNPSPAEVRDALAGSLRDPSLELVYWLPEFGAYADLDGREVKLPPPGEGRAVTPIDAEGVRRAALLHDPTLVEEPELLEAAAAAAGIALENTQLQVERQARLEELRGSRARIVEAGQKERERLERDLHDGAQQRLIALSLELRYLERRLSRDPEAGRRLSEAQREITRSLEELRAVARGLHPAVLTGHGLAVALEQVAARAPVPVRLTVAIDERLPQPVEVAAFYVVTEGLANVAKHARARTARVEVDRAGTGVVVEVIDDGIGGADSETGSGIRGLADRVEALGGRLRVWSPRGGGTRVRADIPCG
jgi:signal transduction histidine kinase